MAVSLKAQHLARYKDIGALLVKHGRSEGLRHFDPEASAATAARPTTTPPSRTTPRSWSTTWRRWVPRSSSWASSCRPGPTSSPAYLNALSRLQDDVEPFSFEIVEEAVTRETGARISNAFQSFESTPRASASLGQVHRAVLRDGRPVAVKVQRPGIRQRIVEDMQVIEELAEFLDSHTGVGRAYGFQGMVEEFRRSIMAELDYRLEAANLRLLGSQLSNYQRIVVPQPIDDYTTSTVLTMDLVDGRNVGSLGPLATLETDRCALAKDLFDAYLDQILVHGFVHADPHPGNVLLTTDGRLALIDLGMVVRIAPELQDDLVRLLLALSESHGTDVASILTGLGDKRENWDRLRFEREISALVQRNQAVTVGQLQAGRMVGELARIAGDCGLRPPVELTMLGKTLLNLDQVAIKIDPDFDPNAAIQRQSGRSCAGRCCRAPPRPTSSRRPWTPRSSRRSSRPGSTRSWTPWPRVR